MGTVRIRKTITPTDKQEDANDQEAVARGVDRILAAGKAVGLPVALNGRANIAQRMAQGARIFMGEPR